MNKRLYPLLGLLLISGCSMYQPPDTLEFNDSKLVIADKTLGSEIRSTSAHILKDSAQITLLNKTANSYQLQARFYWYAKQGLEAIPYHSQWKTFSLDAKKSITIKQEIPNASVVDFRLEVKE